MSKPKVPNLKQAAVGRIPKAATTTLPVMKINKAPVAVGLPSRIEPRPQCNVALQTGNFGDTAGWPAAQPPMGRPMSNLGGNK